MACTHTVGGHAAEVVGEHAAIHRAIRDGKPDEAAAAAGVHLDNTLEDYRREIHRWHRDRVVLLGDSAWCMTLSSGMGVAAGVAAAELLGNAQSRHPGRIDVALRAWEDRLRPFIHYHQREAVRRNCHKWVSHLGQAHET